jgi:hypothetical protein
MADHPEDHLADRFGGMDDLDKVRWMIEADRWAFEAVAPRGDVDPPSPAYAYTVGVGAAFAFPEIAVFGLTPAAAKGLVGMVVDSLDGGTEIPIGVELAGLLDNDLRCRFAPVDLDRCAAWFPILRAWADETPGAPPISVVQLLYPDRNGFMPYEDGYERRMRFAQPVIGDIVR